MLLDLPPILSALRRNRIGAGLIALQMAITLAILGNALFIVQHQLALMARPSGVDEADIFVVSNDWTLTGTQVRSLAQADVEALRSLPGVIDAYVTNSYPLENSGWGYMFTLHPDAHRPLTQAAAYFGDEHTLRTLGLRLVAGRNFDPSEIENFTGMSSKPLRGVIVTRALADELSPGGDVLGRVVTIMPTSQTAPIIGVVDRLQVPWPTAPPALIDNAALLPYRLLGPSNFYVVRVRPGAIAGAMKAAPAALLAISRGRIIEKVQALTAARRAAYRGQRGLAVVLTLVCAMLLTVTACGIVALASHWVAQRRRQIGIRRALGATRVMIMRHFQTETLLISAAGALLGVALALGANLWMVEKLAMARLPVVYLLVGVAIILVLGQLAALRPALRAASVPPAEATRTV